MNAPDSEIRWYHVSADTAYFLTDLKKFSIHGALKRLSSRTQDERGWETRLLLPNQPLGTLLSQ